MKNTLFIRDGETSQQHYTIHDMKDVRGIIIFEKWSMLEDVYNNMTIEQRKKYLFMTTKGMRSRNFLHARSMFHKLATELGVDLKSNDFYAGDCDVQFLQLALSVEHIVSILPAEKCIISNTTIVGPKPQENTTANFSCFDNAYKCRIGRPLSDKELKKVNLWCRSASIFLATQRDERLEILDGFKNGERQFQHESYPM